MNEKLNEVYRRFSKLDPRPAVPNIKIHTNPYRSLISVMLSAQTRDEMTQKASAALFALADNPQDMLKLDYDTIMAAIKPVSFYTRKAQYIIDCSQQLIDRHGGQVPNNRKDLMELSGIGRKSTDIMMRFVYGEAAIAVDTHVHRVVNRLGLIDTPYPNKTADFLAAETPDEYKWNAHDWLITHGKYTCTAVGAPKCGDCPLKDLCKFYNENKEK